MKHHAACAIFSCTSSLRAISLQTTNFMWVVKVLVVVHIDIVSMHRHVANQLEGVTRQASIKHAIIAICLQLRICIVRVVCDESTLGLVLAPVHRLAPTATISYEIAS